MLDKKPLKISLLTLCVLLASCTTSSPQAPNPQPSAPDQADFATIKDLGQAPQEHDDGQDISDMSVEMDQAAPAPLPPASLVRYLIGDEADAKVTPKGPGWILMGGGPDVDAAFVWWREKLNGGDVVVLRTSGEDGYNSYLYTEIGGADSVETLLVTSRQLAQDPYVAWRVSHAEGVFIAGGDQATYTQYWRDTALSRALKEASARGAVIGGTSAGCAILGQFVFSAIEGTITSEEAIEDPYSMKMVLEDAIIPTPALSDIITDTHFFDYSTT